MIGKTRSEKMRGNWTSKRRPWGFCWLQLFSGNYEVIVTPRSRGISGRADMAKPQCQALPSSFQENHRREPIVSRSWWLLERVIDSTISRMRKTSTA